MLEFNTTTFTEFKQKLKEVVLRMLEEIKDFRYFESSLLDLKKLLRSNISIKQTSTFPHYEYLFKNKLDITYLCSYISSIDNNIKSIKKRIKEILAYLKN